MDDNSEDIQGSSWGWWKIFAIIIAVNYVIGIAFVEYFYYITRRLRHLKPEIRKKMGPVSNAPEKWNRFVFYLCSVTMVPRFLGMTISTFTLAVIVHILMLGQDPGQEFRPWRKALIKLSGRTFIRINLLFASVLWISHVERDIDYSEWLGPDYKSKAPKKAAPIIITNHQSWADAFLVLTIREFPTFLAHQSVRDYPFFGKMAIAINTVFVKREDANSRAATIGAIQKRVEQINEKEGKFSPLYICPEGCTSNGTALLRFKRGAFDSMAHVKPMYLEYFSPFFSISFDIISLPNHVLFCCLQPFTYLRVQRMPVLFPTKYMLEKYGNPDSPPSEVYANVAQDIYSKTFGLPKSDISLQQKEDFFQYLCGSDKGNFKLD